MAYLPLIADGLPGRISHTNQIHAAVNSLTGANGIRTINVQSPPAGLAPAVGNITTDDSDALQAIFDYVKPKPSEYEIWFPNTRAGAGQIPAEYTISKPLRVWSNTRIRGPAVIREHVNFDWVNHPYWQHEDYAPVGVQQPGDIALMELWSRSLNGRGSTCRIFIQDITLQGRGTAGSLGLFTKMQQPGYTMKLRINDFDVGWLLWGQQSEHYGVIIVDCGVGIYMGWNLSGLNSYNSPGVNDSKFMSFYALNIEKYRDAAIRLVDSGPNWFQNLHFEMNPAFAVTPNIYVIDAEDSIFTLRNGWATHDGTPNHVFHMHPGNKSYYTIEDFKIAGTNTAGQRYIDDEARGFHRLVDLQRTIDSFRTVSQNSTEHNYDAGLEFLGDDGGTVRIGGVKGGTAAPVGHSGSQMTLRPNRNQADPTLYLQDQEAVLRAGVQNGNLFLGSYPTTGRPSAASLRDGVTILNITTHALNHVSGGVWRDAMGVAT